MNRFQEWRITTKAMVLAAGVSALVAGALASRPGEVTVHNTSAVEETTTTTVPETTTTTTETTTTSLPVEQRVTVIENRVTAIEQATTTTTAVVPLDFCGHPLIGPPVYVPATWAFSFAGTKVIATATNSDPTHMGEGPSTRLLVTFTKGGSTTTGVGETICGAEFVKEIEMGHEIASVEVVP